MSSMVFRDLGGRRVSAIGIGTMPMTGARARPSDAPGAGDARARAIATIHAALDAGVTLFDTADAYVTDGEGQGSNELLVAEALAAYGGGRGANRARVVVATKGGLVNRADGPWEHNGRPEHLKLAARASLWRLGGEALDLYQLHRPDPRVPYADSVGALRELLDEGLIRMAGISNATVAHIEIAREVLGPGRLAAVQNEFSPHYRAGMAELETCTRHGIAFLAWSPLGGMRRARTLGGDGDARAFADVAAERGVTPQQVTLAWELTLGPTVIPIPGASRASSIRDAVAALDLSLTDEERARLDVPPAENISAY